MPHTTPTTGIIITGAVVAATIVLITPRWMLWRYITRKAHRQRPDIPRTQLRHIINTWRAAWHQLTPHHITLIVATYLTTAAIQLALIHAQAPLLITATAGVLFFTARTATLIPLYLAGYRHAATTP